jgi:subtilisin-like proprotein convertase family protein
LVCNAPPPPDNDWTVQVQSAGWGDATTWSLLDVNSAVVLSGGPYGNGYNDTQVANIDNSLLPLTFVISGGGLLDNCPNYTISCESVGVVLSGSLTCGGLASTPNIVCAPPLPPGEFCSSAIPLSCGASVSGTTTGIANDNSTSGAGTCITTVGTAGQIWYEYVSPLYDATVTLSLCGGAGWDTKLHVYSGSCGALTCVTGNDDFCGLQSQVTFSATAGVPYLVRMGGFGAGNGAYTLNVSCVLLADPGELCSGPIAINCSSPQQSGTTVGVINDNIVSLAPACGTSVGTGGQMWYQFTSAENSNVVLNTCGSSFDTKLHVYSGSCGSLVCVTGNDDFCGLQSEVGFLAVAGVPYLVRVGGFQGDEGAYVLNVVSCSPVCTFPAATANIQLDCGNSQFFIAVTITDVGDSPGGLVDVANTGGYPTQTGLALNDVVVLGPFAALTSVSYSVVNTANPLCTFVSQPFTTTCQLCPAGPTSTADSNVQLVSINGFAGSGFTHNGCPGVLGAQNLSSLSVDVPAGFTYPLTVQFGTCGGAFGWAGQVWIDWNGNLTFEPGESIGTATGNGTAAPVSFNVSPPFGTSVGAKFMRVMQWEGGALPLNPCGSFLWGSVMDFTVNVIADPGCTPPQATVSVISNCPNQQFSLSVNVTSTGDSPGGIVNITNTGGAPTIVGAGTGVQVIGPFPVGTPVNVSVTHLGNSLCTSNYNNFDSNCNPVDFCNPALSASPNSVVSGTNITTFSTINVGPQAGGAFLTDLDVVVQINHTWVSELNVTLISPCGTSVTLQNAQCGFTTNMQARYNDEATDNFAAWCGSRLGSVIPQNALSAFDDEPIQGIWTLAVTNLSTLGSGTLVQWCLLPTLTTCVDPVLATSDITNTTITVDVAATGGCIPPGTYGTFDVAWEDSPGCGAPCGSATGVTFPYTITGLDPSTFYDITVVANCTAGGSSNLVGTGVSTLACDVSELCNYTLTLNRTSGTGFSGGLVEVNNGWSVTSYSLPNNLNTISYSIIACPGVQLSVSLNNGGQGGLDNTHRVRLTNSGNVNVLDDLGPNEGQLIVLPDPCPDCAAPLNVTLGQYAADFVSVSWSNGGDPTDDYLVELSDVTFGFPIPVDFVVVAGTSTSFSFPSSPSTDFEVCVTSNCSNGGASLPTCLSFVTPSCDAADQCTYRIQAGDTGGDGWGQYGIEVVIDGGAQIIPYSLLSGSSGSYDFYLCSGSTIEVLADASGPGGGGSGPFTGCVQPSQFGGATIDGNGALTTISTCNFAGEFAPITIVTPGVYEFAANVPTTYITLTNGSNTILANGATTPLIVTIPTAGAYRVHYSLNAACGTASSCIVTTGRRLITCSQPSVSLILNPNTDNFAQFSAAAGSFCSWTDGQSLYAGSTCPTCFDMSAETVFNVTGTSAEFSWTSANGPGTNAVIYVGAPGFDYTNSGEVLFSSSVPITVVGQNFGSVSGLSTLTSYEAVIVEECNAPSGDFSLPGSTLSFTTLNACPDAANLQATVGAATTTICFDVLYPDADYTVTVGQPSTPGWVVNVFSAGWGDGTTWFLRNSSNVVIAQGGPYGNGFNVTVPVATVPGSEPLSFQIISTFGDNSPNYSISCNGVVLSGNLPPNQNQTFPGLVCNTPAPPVTYTGTAGVGQECIPLTGLSLNTTYEYCVGYECGIDGSNNVVCNTFTTPAIANGICSDAIAVTCGSSVSGTTVGSPLFNEYINCGAGGTPAQNGVWYLYTGDNSDVTASLCGGASYDSRLTVYRGACGAFECVTGNDDACGLQSSVTFTALNGYNYYILVHGFGQPGSTGAFTMAVNCTPLNCSPTASNPYCSTAQSVTPEPFGDCTLIAGNNSCSAITTFPAPGCAPVGARIVWYSVTANNVAHNFYIYWNGIVSPGLVLQGSCGVAGGCVAAVANGGFVQATGLVPGNTYFIGVFSTQANAGAFNFCVTNPPPPAPNDLCAGAYPLTPGNGVCGPTQQFNSLDFTTTNSPVAAPACGAYNGLDQWFSVVMPVSGEVTIRTTAGTITNSAIAAYVGTCAGTLSQIGCSAGGALGNMAQLVVNATPGNTVYIRAWAEGGGILGTFDVCAIGQPTNDQCSTPANVNIVAETCFNQVGSVNFATSNNTPTVPFSSCATNGGGRDVWYQFTAETSTMFVTAQGLAGGFDMVVEAWDGCAGTLLGCANNTGVNTPIPPFCDQTGPAGFPSNPACEAAICGADSFCCTNSWDGICAGAAATNPACVGCLSTTPAGAGLSEELTLTGLTPGNTYLLRFYHNALTPPTGNGLFTFCVRHTWNAQLGPGACNVFNYTSNSILSAVYPGGPYTFTGNLRNPLIHVPQDFEWKFVNTTTLNEYTHIRGQANYNVGLSWPLDAMGNPMEYNQTYDVFVRIKVNNIWGDYSSSCTIGLIPLPATTQLRPNYTPTNPQGQPYNLCNSLSANLVALANRYEFELDNGIDPVILAESNTYHIPLTAFAGIQMNTVYQVRVRARVDGVWGNFGLALPITIGLPANTSVWLSHCNTVRPASGAGSNIAAYNVCAASQYVFRFQHTSEPERIVVRPTYVCPFNTVVPALTPGQTYTVSVRVTQGGVQGDYSTSCPITIAGPQTQGLAGTAVSKVSLEDITAAIFPNPNAGDQVSINMGNIVDEHQMVTVDVYDIYGKRVHIEEFANSGSELNRVITFGQELAPGMYLINIYLNNEQVLAEKLVVQ